MQGHRNTAFANQAVHPQMRHLSPHCLLVTVFVSAAQEEPCLPGDEGPALPLVWRLNKVQLTDLIPMQNVAEGIVSM